MIRKFLNIAAAILVPILVLALLGFAVSKNKKQLCSQVSVLILNSNENRFVDAESLKKEIMQSLPSIEGNPVRGSVLNQIKEAVDKNPYVKESSVYRKIDGNITVKVTQRVPLFRVLTAHNQGYYIDVDGTAMPLCNNYTARVIIAGGSIYSGYATGLNVMEASKGKGLSTNVKLLADLYELVSFISQNPFWNAFIDYIHVNPGNKFELTPKNGAHLVEFGSKDRMEKKFTKLETFYQNAIPKTGWEKYGRIKLQYKNQIVCSK